MKFQYYSSLFMALLATHPVLASLSSFAQVTPNELMSQIEGGAWYRCDDVEKVWCQDEFQYYKLSSYAELSKKTDNVELVLFYEYSAHRLSELQLNLRRDAFGLDRVAINHAHFDVQAELNHAQTAKQVNEVDKKLIQFLSRFAQSDYREMNWSNRSWSVLLTSDGELITLTFTEREL